MASSLLLGRRGASVAPAGRWSPGAGGASISGRSRRHWPRRRTWRGSRCAWPTRTAALARIPARAATGPAWGGFSGRSSTCCGAPAGNQWRIAGTRAPAWLRSGRCRRRLGKRDDDRRGRSALGFLFSTLASLRRAVRG